MFVRANLGSRGLCALALLLTAWWPANGAPLGSAFTYQGQLRESGQPATGLYDLQVCLFDDPVNPVPLACNGNLDDVPVADGVFSVALDFGNPAFAGEQRFLELRVRAGASSGVYTTLAPRQLIRPAPEALRATTSSAAPWSGLTGLPAGFADGVDDTGTGTVTSIATGTGLTGGPITGSGTIAIAAGGVGTAQLANDAVDAAKLAANAVDTAAIADAGVTTAKLAANAVDAARLANSAVDTAAIVDGNVTSAKIAPGAVGIAQINTGQVQARVSGSCGIGDYFRGINADGSLACEPIPGLPRITTVEDTANFLGVLPAVAIGTDGLPIIAHFNASLGDIKVVKCSDSACSGSTTITTVDAPAEQLGFDLSIAIGSDGIPVLAYGEVTGSRLKIAKCANPACTGSATITVLDESGIPVGNHAQIAVGADGLPVIAYQDSSAGALRVAKCANPACTGSASIAVVDDPVDYAGRDPSIAIGTDGLPVIAYSTASVGFFKVAKCVNPDCSGSATVTTINDPSSGVAGLSIAIGTDGRPVISYRVGFSSLIKVAQCANAACTSTSSITLIDDLPDTSLGADTSIAIGADGVPVVAYGDLDNGAIKIARCSNTACVGPAAVSTLEDPANTVNPSNPRALAIGRDGLPVVAYTDNTAGALKVAKCGTRGCQ